MSISFATVGNFVLFKNCVEHKLFFYPVICKPKYNFFFSPLHQKMRGIIFIKTFSAIFSQNMTDTAQHCFVKNQMYFGYAFLFFLFYAQHSHSYRSRKITTMVTICRSDAYERNHWMVRRGCVRKKQFARWKGKCFLLCALLRSR